MYKPSKIIGNALTNANMVQFTSEIQIGSLLRFLFVKNKTALWRITIINKEVETYTLLLIELSN